MCLIDEALDLEALIFGSSISVWLIWLNEDVDGTGGGGGGLVEKQLDLFLVVLESADKIQVFATVELPQHLSESCMI